MSKKTRLNPRLDNLDASDVRVAGYIRVSTDKQKASGLGLADQRKKIGGMCDARGWPEPTLYVDEGISGTKETKERKQLAALIAAIEAGQVDVVVINSLDRLARRVRLTLELVDLFKKHGVALVSCKETLDTATPSGQLFVTLLAAMAEFERELARERTMAAQDVLVSTGKVLGGGLPYGYVRLDDGYEIDPEEAAIVREIHMLRGWGWSLRKIAENLNNKGRPTPRGGDIWRHTTIKQIVDNEAVYRGAPAYGQSGIALPRILKGKAA